MHRDQFQKQKALDGSVHDMDGVKNGVVKFDIQQFAYEGDREAGVSLREWSADSSEGVSVEGHTPDLIRSGEVTRGDGLQTYRRIEYAPGAGTGTLVTWTEGTLPRHFFAQAMIASGGA